MSFAFVTISFTCPPMRRTGPSGEIGRRAGFRCQCSQELRSSSLLLGTQGDKIGVLDILASN